MSVAGELEVTGDINYWSDAEISISSTGKVTVNNISGSIKKIDIQEGGKLIVNTNLSVSNLSVAGELEVGGILNSNEGSISILSTGKVEVKELKGTNLSGGIKVNGILSVDGAFSHESYGNLDINGGTVEIKGLFKTGMDITVSNKGNLIIHDNLVQGGNNLIVSDGLVIIKGNYTTYQNTTINVDGTLILGGDFTYPGHDGSLNIGTSNNPEENDDGKLYMTKNPSTVNEKDHNYPGLDDLLNEKGDDENIMDWLDKTGLSGSNIEWTGAAEDGDWFNDKNWSPEIAPKSTSNVTIKAVETVSPSLNSDEGKIEIKNLTIEAGASLTLEPGNSLVISQDFEVKDNGKFIIQSSYGENKISSFNASGNTIGEVNIELTLPTNSWYYLSTPMKEQLPKHYSTVQEGFSGTPYYYNYVNNAWAISPTKIEQTEGISAYYLTSNTEEKEVTLKYEGKLNTGDVTKTMTKKGFYLFGNPYAVPINWQDKNMVREKVAGTIWYRTRVEGEKGSKMGFVTYNRYAPDEGKVAVYPNEYKSREKEFSIIQPYQSVWVYTRTATSDNPAKITISNAQKVPNNQGGTLKSSSAGKKADIIRVVSKNSISRDGAVIYFSEDATDGSDDAGDSPKYFNSSVDIPEVYTKVGSNSLAINGLAPFEGEYELPLSVRNRTTDEVTLSFNLSNYRKDDVIVLYDRYLDEKINLRSTNKYSYTPLSLGDDHNRFVMLFNPEGYEDENVSTDISDILADANNSQNISIVEKSGNAIVTVNQHLLDKGAGKIEVYSIDGVKLSESVIYSSKTLIVLPKDKGVYVVVATASGERKVEKLLIK